MMNATNESVTRSQDWQRFISEMQLLSADPIPLEAQGILVRAAGLVLEATGIRVPVGSVCEVFLPGQAPVQAEVVGFSGDRAYLMPTGDVHGLVSGARVVPRSPPTVRMTLQKPHHPCAGAKIAPCTCRWVKACWGASSIRRVNPWTTRDP